jgi:dynein heavy chain
LRIFLDEYNEIPFKVLNFICASINYGGRVTDDKDELLIKSILKNFLNSEVLKDEFAFCPDKRYYSVNSSTQLGYINYIESLPLNTAPNVFGLHNNAEITTNQNRSTEFIKTVLKCNNSGS